MRYIPSITESHRKTLNDELSSVDGKFIDETEVKKRTECAEKYCRALEARIPGNFSKFSMNSLFLTLLLTLYNLFRFKAECVWKFCDGYCEKL